MRILMFSMLLLFSNLFTIMHALGHCLPDQKSVLLQIRTQITHNSSASTKLVLWDEGADCCGWPGLSCNFSGPVPHKVFQSVLLQIRSEITYNSSESTKLALWDEGADCCRWPGLSCNAATGFITSLDLSDDYSIRGGFNVSLLHKLPSLSVIRLDGVDFSAPFPDFFTDFTNLTVLSLRGCNFTGTVPHKVFQLNTTVLFKKIDKLKLTRFSEALGADFALGHYKIWGHVHLLFFPILQQNHLYLLCVDFKFEWLEIIDNSASTQPTPVKYGDTPENVKLLLSECFTSVGEKFKSIVCDNLKTKRMSMTWRDTKNKVDYGMYLMRHMESYVSEAVKVLQNGIVGLLVVTDRNFRGYVCVI